MYVLDTNVVSEIRKTKAGKADPNVAAWAGSIDTELTYISAITIQELEYGVLLAEHRDPPAGAILRNWLNHDVHETFKQRILPIDTEVARLAAAFHVPDPAPIVDALIAATAKTHNMTVATHNIHDFKRFTQLKTFNPWNGELQTGRL